MASCMECTHFNPCNMHSNIIVEKSTKGNGWEFHNNVENECEHFTPTAEEILRLANKMIDALNECDDEALTHTIWERITRYDPFTEAEIKVYTEDN